MIKKLLLTILLALSFASAFAQEGVVTQEFKRHEFRLGAAGYPAWSSYAFWLDAEISREQKGWELGSSHRLALVSFTYEYYFKKWFSLQKSLALCGEWERAKAPGTDDWFTDIGLNLVSTTMARFTYINRPKLRLYSGISLGIIVFSCLLPTAELVPIGVSFGTKFFGFAEVGVGTDYNGCNFGIGYRF